MTRWFHAQVEVGAEDDGEDEFVAFEERATDVGVQRIREVVTQVTQTSVQLLRLVADRSEKNGKEITTLKKQTQEIP